MPPMTRTFGSRSRTSSCTLAVPSGLLEAILEDAVDEVLERWRKALARIDYGGDDLPLTMSFGVARARPGESLASLRLRADEALYRAKNDGRDRIVFADAE